MTGPSVTVAIGTYGDPQWRALAESRAIPSARAQGVPVIHVHGLSLHEARNSALERVDTSDVVFLDADDELEPGYVNAMTLGTADVRAPRVRYVRSSGVAAPPVMPRVSGHHHQCEAGCLAYGNWVVIGAMVRTDLLRKVGGWADYPVYEDWFTWASCWQAGATFEPVLRAIYRAYVRRDSRNRAPDRDVKLAAHRAIASALGLPVP